MLLLSAVFLSGSGSARGRHLLVLPWFCRRAKMTRSHALLYCTSEKLRGARKEAWEGSIRVLLSNPRWERLLVKFLELSGVGRVSRDGQKEWTAGSRGKRRREWKYGERAKSTPFPYFPFFLLRETHTPSFVHSVR